jgi:hypothetical protein
MILKKYKKLKNRILIINNKTYRTIIKQIFPELTFDRYREDDEDNFYFNIRSVIKEQDVFIDIIKNYDKYVYTKKIYLLPWYDMNDPLIVYSYNSKYKIRIQKFIDYIDMFTKMKRCNYNGSLWDTTIEYNIFKKYNTIKPSDNIRMIYSMFNQYVMKNYHYNLPVVKYMTQYSVNNVSTPPVTAPSIAPPSIPKPPPPSIPKPPPPSESIIPPSSVPIPDKKPDEADDEEPRKKKVIADINNPTIVIGQASVYEDKSLDINQLLDALNKKIESLNNILRN